MTAGHNVDQGLRSSYACSGKCLPWIIRWLLRIRSQSLSSLWLLESNGLFPLQYPMRNLICHQTEAIYSQSAERKTIFGCSVECMTECSSSAWRAADAAAHVKGHWGKLGDEVIVVWGWVLVLLQWEPPCLPWLDNSLNLIQFHWDNGIFV